MYFSGKISNSVLNYLDKQGVALEGLYDLTDLPVEFLRDASSWLEAEKLEKFLRSLDQAYGMKIQGCFMSEVGRNCFRLRSWGVLDSVLRIMQKPNDIYLQPERFISYFVSPAPPLGKLHIGEDKISFELPISTQEFPYVTSYMRSALESLPKYIGKQRAHVDWKHNHISILWQEQQETLMAESELGSHMRPELVRTMAMNLEQNQQELEKKNEELTFKEQEIHRLKSDIQNLLRTPIAGRKYTEGDIEELPEEIQIRLSEIKNHVMLMNDYLARAQQIITLLSGKGRNEAQVKLAMKRVGWDQVVASRAQITRITLDQVETLRSKMAECKSIHGAYGTDTAAQNPKEDSSSQNLQLL